MTADNEYEGTPIDEAVAARFAGHAITPEQLAMIDEIRLRFTRLGTYVETMVPAGHERVLCMKAMEDACMRAVRAVTHQLKGSV